jgi:hypothetical protein
LVRAFRKPSPMAKECERRWEEGRRYGDGTLVSRPGLRTNHDVRNSLNGPASMPCCFILTCSVL